MRKYFEWIVDFLVKLSKGGAINYVMDFFNIFNEFCVKVSVFGILPYFYFLFKINLLNSLKSRESKLNSDDFKLFLSLFGAE